MFTIEDSFYFSFCGLSHAKAFLNPISGRSRRDMDIIRTYKSLVDGRELLAWTYEPKSLYVEETHTQFEA
jgi:hypothetical protein